MVKLQFSKVKKEYLNGKGKYEYTRIALHFPKRTQEILLPLKGKKLFFDIYKEDKTIFIVLTDPDEA
jgi:hypothetical protein